MRKGVAQGEGRKDRNRNRNVKAASHELPEPDHMQEYHNGIEDTTKRDSDHQADDTSITKETKSEDMESADGSPFQRNIAVISNGNESNAEKLGYEDHTKTEPTVEDEAMNLQCIDSVRRGQYKGTEMTAVIENQIENQSALDSAGPSRTERKGNDNIFEQSEEVAEHVTETENLNIVGKADKNVQVLEQNRMEINEASPQNQTDLEQMEESKVINNMRTDDKDDQFEDAKIMPEMEATNLPIVSEELPSKDNQVSTTFSSRVVGAEGNVVDSGMKQNAENEMQQTLPIINHSVTEHPPLEDKVIEDNREDVNEECLNENKKDDKCEPEMGAKDLPIVTEELPSKENQVSKTFSSRELGVEGNVVDSRMKQNDENEMQQTVPIINHSVTEHPPLEVKVIEDSREDVNEECLKENKKDDKCEPEMGATDLPIVAEEFPSKENQVSTTFSSQVVGVEGNVVDSRMKQNAENEMQQTVPIINHSLTEHPPLEDKVIEDNIQDVNEESLKTLKEMIDMGESQHSHEEEHLEEEKHNGSVPSENGQECERASSSAPEASEKNTCDSPTDAEVVARLKANDLHSSLDDSSNKEKEENELQTSTKGEVTEIEKKADTILNPSDEYCQQRETSRASCINEEENQGEEKNDGSIAWSNDQVGVGTSSSFNVPSEKNMYDSLNDDEQGEKLKSNNVRSLSDESWKHKQEEEDFQASPNSEATERGDKADYKLASSKEYCQQRESSGGSSINEEENQGEEKRNGSVACNSGQAGNEVSNSVHVPSTNNICDSPRDNEQEEIPKWTNVFSSSDDSWNEEKEKEGFKSSTKDEATESKGQAENKLVSSDGYIQQRKTLRASNINKEENQVEEQHNGLIECNNGQEVKEATNIVHAPSEENM